MYDAIPAFGRAAFKAGHMMDLHSASVSVHAGKGYLGLADIFVSNVVQASTLVECPVRIFVPQFIAAVFRSLINRPCSHQE